MIFQVVLLDVVMLIYEVKKSLKLGLEIILLIELSSFPL